MKRFLALALSLAMSLSLVACGNNSEPSESTPTEPSNPSASTPVEETKEYKKDIVIGGNFTIDNYDLQRLTSAQQITVILGSFDRLVDLDPETGEFIPMLAKSWTVSDDGLVYTFELRDDVTFHNGEKFTADDVVFTWERAATYESAGSSVKKAWGYAEKCEAQGDYTVVMTLGKQNPDMLYWLQPAYMGILDRTTTEADMEKGLTIGTGLWKLEEAMVGDHFTYVRNDDYWGETTPTETMEFRIIPEASARLIALENGEIDYAYEIADNEVTYVEQNDDLKLIQGDSMGTRYFGFISNTEGPWHDANFRKAVAHALNRDDIILAAGGYGTPAYTLWNPVQVGFAAQEDAYKYDVALAKDYLSKSSYAGESFAITSTSGYKNAILTIIDQLKAVGINATYDEQTTTTMNPLIKERTLQAFVYNINLNYFGEDSRRHMYDTTYGAQIHADAPSYDECFALFDKAMASNDEAERVACYEEIQELIAEDACMFPLYYGVVQHAASKDLEGVPFAPDSRTNFTYAKVLES